MITRVRMTRWSRTGYIPEEVDYSVFLNNY
jgi:hypothetical protein